MKNFWTIFDSNMLLSLYYLILLDYFISKFIV